MSEVPSRPKPEDPSTPIEKHTLEPDKAVSFEVWLERLLEVVDKVKR